MPAEDAIESLSTIKPITRDSTVEDVGEVAARHQAAIKQVGGDVQRLAERLPRFETEMREALKAARSNETAEYEAHGSARDLDRFFLREDGTVQFRTGAETVTLPDGSTVDLPRRGFFATTPVTPEHDAVQRAYASWALAASRARRGGVKPMEDVYARRSFANFVRELRNLPGKTGAYCRAMLADKAAFERVIKNTSGSGGELIMTPTTSEIRRPAMLARRIPGLVKNLPAPAPSFKPPIISGHKLATKRGATTDDPQRFPVSTFTTSDTTVTVVDQVIAALVDPQWLEDTAPVLTDPMAEVMGWLDQNYADTLEAAFLHGDTAATHQDTISSWTLDSYYTAGDMDGSNSALRWWIGARGRAVDDSKTGSAGGTFDASDHYGALAAMKNLGGGAKMIVGLNGYLTQILANSLFFSYDKMGPMAVSITGGLGKVGDSDVIISEFMPKEFDTTSGVYTGSNKGNEFLYWNPDAYAYYERAAADADFDAVYPERGARYVGMVRRGILNAQCLSGEYPAYVLYNL